MAKANKTVSMILVVLVLLGLFSLVYGLYANAKAWASLGSLLCALFLTTSAIRQYKRGGVSHIATHSLTVCHDQLIVKDGKKTAYLPYKQISAIYVKRKKNNETAKFIELNDGRLYDMPAYPSAERLLDELKQTAPEFKFLEVQKKTLAFARAQPLSTIHQKQFAQPTQPIQEHDEGE